MEIIGTDINTDVIKKAKKGRYKGRTLHFMPESFIERYFYRSREGMYCIKDLIKDKVRFKVHNLLKDEPPGFYFDIIFCRNVMIYFDLNTQRALVDGIFRRAVSPHGYLLIGHSESLISKSECFEYAHLLKAPIYRFKTDIRSKKEMMW